MEVDERRAVLKRFTDDPSVLEELLRYNENTFDFSQVDEGLDLPLPPERHVADWHRYVADAARDGVEAVLRRIFPALLFPIAEGMAEDPALKAARMRGALPEDRKGGSSLDDPRGARLFIHPTAAGEIPVIVLPDRRDFDLLIRVIYKKNEPVSIPPSMGAAMVVGYNNWDRIAQLRARWESEHGEAASPLAWSAYFRNDVMPNRASYQDRFIVLSRGPYSDVPASELGLEPEHWLDLSMTIRLEHECAHYLTKRALGSMRDNAFDELLADYAGIVAACGEFRAEWFLRFVGLERADRYRQGARLENYRGDPPLSDAAFKVIHALVGEAAAVLAARGPNGRQSESRSDAPRRGRELIELARGTLELMPKT